MLQIIPLAFIGDFVVNIIDSVARSGFALVILGVRELVAENLIVGFRRGLVDDNVLLVVGDLEDHKLDSVRLGVCARAELVEHTDDIVTNGNTGRGLFISK